VLETVGCCDIVADSPEGVPPPASPLLRPPTTSSAKLLTFYAGADS
jgi:hypothetical protein